MRNVINVSTFSNTKQMNSHTAQDHNHQFVYSQYYDIRTAAQYAWTTSIDDNLELLY